MSGENGGRPLPSPGIPPDEGALTGVLADYLAGLLDDTPEGEAVTARIAEEPAWAAAYAELRAADTVVRADLERYLTGDDVVAEQTIPPDVAARLDKALDAALSSAGTDAGTADRETADVVPLDAARRRRAPRWVTGGGAVAAGIVVLAAAALGAGSLLSSQEDSAPSSAEAPVESRAQAPSPSGKAGTLGADESGRGPQLTASDTDYSAETVGRTAVDLVAPRGPKPAPGGANANEFGRVPDAGQVAPELRRLTSPSDLNSCLEAIGGTTLSAEFASFDGKPALIVVVADSGTAPTRVVVVGPDCGLSGTDEQYHEDVPR